MPARGEKRRLAELAGQNARLALDSERLVSEQKQLRRVHALEELREALNLESLPLRIECFDISNIQGHEIVGSMVVFQDGIAKKAHYRKFAVRGLDGQDDFAAMAEVVSRRFARLRKGTEADYDEGFATAPNLVVIDGGKGQLSAALAAMQAYELPRVAVISLAKRIEEVFVPQQADPILLDPHQRRLATAPTCPGRGTSLRARLPSPAPVGTGTRVALRHARGRRPGAPACALAALRLDRGRDRGEPGGAGGRPGRPGEDGALDLRAAAPDRQPRMTRGR